MKLRFFIPALAAALVTFGAEAEVRVPAFTAYLEPDSGARVSSRSGVTRWKDPAAKVLWFGEFKSPGQLDAALELRLAENTTSKLRLTVAGQAREAEAKGAGTNAVTVRFGSFQ